MPTINDYLKKIDEYAKKASFIREVPITYDPNIFKNDLQTLIDNKRDYLLTDAFLYYIVVNAVPYKEGFSRQLSCFFKILNKKLYIIIEELLWGYMLVLSEHRFLNSRFSSILDECDDILEYQNGLEKEIHDTYQEYHKKLKEHPQLNVNYYANFELIYLKLLSIAFYKQDVNVFRERADHALSDPMKQLDDMYFHDLFFEGYPDRSPVIRPEYANLSKYIAEQEDSDIHIK